MADPGPIHAWDELDEAELREYASRYVGFATNEMGDPEDLAWALEHQFPLADFRSMPTDWAEYHADDVLENPRYDEAFSKAEFHTPVVLSVEADELIIWDGWHRIACAIVRGDECITAILGRTR
jgi:hypothetical protein